MSFRVFSVRPLVFDLVIVDWIFCTSIDPWALASG